MKKSIADKYQYKYLPFLTGLCYLTYCLAGISLHKPLQIGFLSLPCSVFIFPLIYIFADIIAEVYGYQIIRQIIWLQIPLAIYYLTMLHWIVVIPAAPGWQQQSAYNYIFGTSSIIIGFFSNAGMVVGFFINAYLLSKWKILLRGRYFWLRSVGSSAIAELLQLLIGLIVIFITGTWPWQEVVRILIAAYLFRLMATALLSGPASFVTKLLKILENIDIHDYPSEFNPFKDEVETKPANRPLAKP